MYDVTENHFVAQIGDRLFDITGDVTDRYNVIEWEKYDDRYDAGEIIKDIETTPTVDAVPVRHGKWITKSTGGEFFDCCSECGYVEWDAPNKYCPHCGSRMDEE